MAFAKGKTTSEAGSVKRYIGVANLKCLGVNLSKEKLSEIYGTEITNDRVFTTEVELNGTKYPAVNLNFTLQKEADKMNDLEFFTTVRYQLVKSPRFDSTGEKMQIIDKYGRTAWATKEDVKNHAVPQYKNGPAQISPDYRVAYRGEAPLVDFLKALIGIDNVTKFVDGKPAGLVDNPEDCECSLENVEKYFNGDVSEITEVLSYQPENKVKLLLGVRSDDQNKLWQDVFTNYPMRAGVRNFDKLEAELNRSKGAGAYPNTVFEVCEVKEYEETPTEVAPTTSDSPWFN